MQQWARQPIFWSALMVLVGFSLLTPLQLITVHFIMVPIVMMMALSHTVWQFALYFGIPALLLLVSSGLAWPITAAVLVLMLVPGALVGYYYRKGSSAVTVMTAGITAMIGVLLLFLIAISMSGINIQMELKTAVQEQLEIFERITGQAVMSEEVLNSLLDVTMRLLPLYIIVIAFYYTVITHVVSRRLLGKLGVPAKALPPVHEWRLPRSLIWYYLIVLVLDFFVQRESGFYTLIMNVQTILLFTFAVQGIAFLFFWAHMKKRSRALPVTGAVLCLLFPPAMYLMSMVGLIDTAFPIRNYMGKR